MFGALELAQIKRLAAYATTRKVRRGTTLFAKGDPGTDGRPHAIACDASQGGPVGVNTLAAVLAEEAGRGSSSKAAG